MNKQLLVVLPVVLMVAGCNAQGENSAVGQTPEPVVETTATATPATPVSSTKASSTAKKESTPDPAYTVVSEVNPRFPADLVAALEKVKVSPPPVDMVVPKKARLRLQTSKGVITVELDEKAAPLHAKSFLYLSKRGFYDNTVLHRYEPGFVIQGGDPFTKSPKLKEYYGAGGPGYQVPRERNDLKHSAFVLSAARSQDPDSAGSQFYITLAPATFLDEGDGYTVFGKVIEGANNVLKLRAGDKLQKVVLLPAAAAKKGS